MPRYCCMGSNWQELWTTHLQDPRFVPDPGETIRFLRKDEITQETVEVVDKIRKEGYSAFKLRFHTDKPEKEVEAVKVLRDKFGKDLDIMVDGNQMCPRMAGPGVLRMQ